MNSVQGGWLAAARRRRSAGVPGVVGVLVVAAIGVVIADRVAAARERDEHDASEPTAWENRVQMEPVLIDTARQLGITSEPLPESDAPLGCERRDGRQDLSYDLPELEGAALDDPESALTDVARAWDELGYAVSSVGGGAGDVWRVSAETPEGAIVEVLTGPAATIVSGETGCFLQDGAPDEAEPTAWENRAEMDRVLLDAARLLGIEPEVQEQREAPVGCVRRDGREGVSYFLHEVRGEPLADPESALATVAESWADAGYAVSDVGQASELWRLTAETQEGAPISVGSGPGGTVLSGETGCFLVDGRPDEG